eukprot:TRINITY_DN80739_c0_g1_i1.p1 TRINITY_DN80739_c0_g1~~TRINITY_DN80739_c0_g1_i1.p1  ORF type:complete len:283 (+),score=59.13 TRINITY_DN80739_c0_g1_i1:47-850(+)
MEKFPTLKITLQGVVVGKDTVLQVPARRYFKDCARDACDDSCKTGFALAYIQDANAQGFANHNLGQSILQAYYTVFNVGEGTISFAEIAGCDVSLDSQSCFPGEAAVSSTPLATYNSSLGFLHALQGPASFIALQHEGGELRASRNHLIFNGEGIAMAAELFTIGDEVMLGSGLRSRVLSINKDTTKHGMLAPLTASGSIEVDGVKASTYATVSKLNLPHSAMHAVFWLSRVFSAMQAMQAEDSSAVKSVNPLAYLFHSLLKLDKLL